MLRNLAMIAFHAGFVRPVLTILGVRFRRRNLVPRGPCLVVGNHNSHLDGPILMSMFPLSRLPHVHPVAAADYFGSNWFLKLLAGILFNGIPIDRKKATGADPLRPVAEALADGESLVFFPEGSRGEAGVVAPFRQGIGRLVQTVPGVLVLPVYMSGPERIWPRGQTVPVPSSIDVSIGKPRVYAHGAPAPEIADQVRRDVLALAPPPPPVPGPRPAPPTRISVCGIDPEARGRIFQKVIERLGRVDPTVGIGERFVEADAEGVREVAGGFPFVPSRWWLGLAGSTLRAGRLYKGSKFVEMVERANVNEALVHARKGRFVVSDGSALVDLLAWADADFYRGVFEEREMHQLVQYLTGQRRMPVRRWWHFLRRAPEVWLLNVLDLVRPPAPDILIVANVDPPTLMARIRSAGEQLGPHDSLEFLETWQRAYEQVAAILKKRWRVDVLQTDPAAADPEETVVEQVEAVCRGLVAETAAPGT
ncbi:MAG: 1-acyl-sn-glycerol-3-phosphate acyltransferase [Acidobacteriota bacterium]|nr:1-acyl-sn-glycerol-3-phosphate acyltransferase [Acidobacteriota bacterium]